MTLFNIILIILAVTVSFIAGLNFGKQIMAVRFFLVSKSDSSEVNQEIEKYLSELKQVVDGKE